MMELWNKDVGLDELNKSFMWLHYSTVMKISQSNTQNFLANDIKHYMNSAEKISMCQKEVP